MTGPDYAAALNADPALARPPRDAETGASFAEALALLGRARFAAVAVRHGEGGEWSYVRLPRAAMARWLRARIEARPAAALSLHSRLTAVYDEELWLFVGAPVESRRANGDPS